MSTRFVNRVNKFVLFSLTFSAALFVSILSVSAVTYSVPQTAGATISWDHNDPAPEGYRVFQRKNGQAYDYTSPVWTGANNSSIVYNLEYDTTYYFVIRAYDGGLESVDSDEVSFTAPTPLPATYSISATASGSGTISPAGVTVVTEGTDQTYTITPDSGYRISDVSVDGVFQGPLAVYTFSAVLGDHSIAAAFEAITVSNDDSSLPDSDDSTDAGDEQNSSVNILYEAEDGDIAWPMEIADDESAGAGGYIWTAEEMSDYFSPSDDAGYVTYDFEISETDQYVIWIRQISNTSSSDSFFLSIDGQDEMVWHTMMGTQDVWTWDVMSLRNAGDSRVTSEPLGIWLAAGHHSLKIRQRESGTKIDALLITNDPALRVDAGLVEQYYASTSFTDEQSTSESIYDLLVSASDDRLNPVSLNGTKIDDEIYVFVEPITDVAKVEFFIDDVLYQTENYAPFDLAGGVAGGFAAPFDTSLLATGAHRVSARITTADGSDETIVADVSVAGYAQLISTAADRSNASALEGTTVEGDIYVFVEPTTDINMVEFFIDGMLYQTESYAPFDLAGGATGGLAAPFDSDMLASGLHQFSVRITKADGSTETIAADVVVAGYTQPATTYAQLISTAADRSNASALEGTTVEGDIYVFVEPAAEIKKVEFFIDDVLYQAESFAPFDLAGGAAGGLAAPFDTSLLTAGAHRFSARITTADGGTETITADVMVAGFSQRISTAADRSNASALEGKTVAGDIYVFVEPASEIKKVEFFIDDILHQTENFAPFDLAGGAAGGLAAPFDTTELGAGRHTFSARITKTDGTMETITDRVSVSN